MLINSLYEPLHLSVLAPEVCEEKMNCTDQFYICVQWLNQLRSIASLSSGRTGLLAIVKLHFCRYSVVYCSGLFCAVCKISCAQCTK